MELGGFGPELVVIAVLVYLLAGLVKGLVGFGLPTIGLGLMTVFVGVETAIVLILWPTFVTNLWQASSGGHLRALGIRLWPFFLSAIATLVAGTFILTQLPAGAADLVLGLLMVAYAIPALVGLVPEIRPDSETVFGVAAGLLNGVFAGLTGSYTVPGVMYLQALGLAKNQLVQAMGVLFLLSTLALGVTLGGFGFLNTQSVLASLGLVLPALTGVLAGQRIRRNVSETAFRRLILASILVLGIYLVPLGIWRLM